MKMPGPSVFGVLKYLPQARQGLLAPLEAIANDWGDAVRIPFPGDPVYLVRSPELVRSFLQEHDDHYRRSYDELKHFMGNGLITVEGAEWRKQRRVIAPMFHGPVVAGFFQLMTEEAAKMAARWKKSADEKGHCSIDVEEEMMDVTLRIVMRCLISGDLEDEGRRLSQLMTLLMEHVVARLRSPWRLPFRWPTPGSRRFYRALRELDQSVYGLIDGRTEKKSGKDLLDLLLMATDADTGQPLSRQMVRDELVTFLLAGHETTAHALTWALEVLGRHPHAFSKLRDELSSADIASASTLKELPYLNRVYRECLRLYPPVWYIERVSTVAHQLGAYDIPKNVRVAVSPYLTHRDPRLFKNPHAFDPDRYLRPDDHTDSRWAWIPYGAGPRSCVGQPMAVMQFQTILARIAKDFSIHSSPQKPTEMDPLITIRPRTPIRITLGVR